MRVKLRAVFLVTIVVAVMFIALGMTSPRVVPRLAFLPAPESKTSSDGCNRNFEGWERSGPIWSRTYGGTLMLCRCRAQQDDCSPAQVIAAVAHYYQLSGATPGDALCLARVSGGGKHALNEALEAPSGAETRAEIKCVGSDARLRAITCRLSDYFREHASKLSIPT